MAAAFGSGVAAESVVDAAAAAAAGVAPDAAVVDGLPAAAPLFAPQAAAEQEACPAAGVATAEGAVPAAGETSVAVAGGGVGEPPQPMTSAASVPAKEPTERFGRIGDSLIDVDRANAPSV